MAAKKPNNPAGECAGCSALRQEMAVLQEQVKQQRADQERWGARAWALTLAVPSALPGLILLVMRLTGH